MLRIGYDAKRLFNNFTGLGNYSRTLLHSLSEYHPDHIYFLYTPSIKQNEETQYFVNNPAFVLRKPPRKWQGIWWRSTGLKKDLLKKKIDLYHGLSHEIPIGIQHTGIKSVVTIHDLIFKRYPTYYKFSDRKIYDWKFKNACRNSDRIIAISESTKRDIMEFYGIPASKIEVIYQSCHEQFKQKRSRSSIKAVLEKYDIPTEFLLSVGSLTERKNLLGLLKAYTVLKEPERLPLVVVGQGESYKRKLLDYIDRQGLHKLVKFVNIRDHELPALYQAASIFVYLSVYEGFGLPIIESLFSQTPVITSNVSSMPEAAGPESLLVDPNNTEELADAITRLLNDTKLRTHVVERGFQYAQKFKAEPLTDQMMQLYRSVLGKAAGPS